MNGNSSVFCLVPAVNGLCSRALLSINFEYDKYMIGILYVFINTQGTHKVYSMYTQGIQKVTGHTQSEHD